MIEKDYHKNLNKFQSGNLGAGDYYVTPINEILDINEFIKYYSNKEY